MKKTPLPQPIKETGATQIERILAELELAVSQLPLKEMSGTVKTPRGAVAESAFVLEHRAEAAMCDLDFIARLGSKDAIRALRNLGNLAAETLLSLRCEFPPSGRRKGLLFAELTLGEVAQNTALIQHNCSTGGFCY